MGVIPQDKKDKLQEGGGMKYIKAEEFEGEGLLLKVKGFEETKANNPKFGGDVEKDALVQQGILGEGNIFRYSFETIVDGEDFPQDRVVESKSLALFIAFTEVDPDEGQVVRIKKEGKMENTRYEVIVQIDK